MKLAIILFITAICWLAVDATLHPHPTMIVKGGK